MQPTYPENSKSHFSAISCLQFSQQRAAAGILYGYNAVICRKTVVMGIFLKITTVITGTGAGLTGIPQ